MFEGQCNCEAEYCFHTSQNVSCPERANPLIVVTYVGAVCEGCADRMVTHGGGIYIRDRRPLHDPPAIPCLVSEHLWRRDDVTVPLMEARWWTCERCGAHGERVGGRIVVTPAEPDVDPRDALEPHSVLDHPDGGLGL